MSSTGRVWLVSGFCARRPVITNTVAYHLERLDFEQTVWPMLNNAKPRTRIVLTEFARIVRHRRVVVSADFEISHVRLSRVSKHANGRRWLVYFFTRR